MPRLTHDQRLQIVTLHNHGGHSVDQLSTNFNCDRRTVQRLLAKFRHTQSVDDRHRAARPSVSTERENCALIRMSSSNPRLVARQLKQRWRTEHGVEASVSTVKSRLRDAGLFGRIAVKKPLLTARHRRTRLEFAQEHRDWTVEQWSRCLFSDESPIHLVASHQQRYVRRRGGTALRQQHIRPTVHSSSGKLMVWGAFSLNGGRPLARICGNLNAASYQDILRDHLLPLNLPQNGLIFQQDNATCHSARTTLRFLEDNNVDVMRWPPQSPDLNPIENLWGYLQQRLDRLEVRTMDELWAAAEREWRGIPQDVITNLVESMPARMALVIAARGGSTRY